MTNEPTELPVRRTPWDEPEGPAQFSLRALLVLQAGFALFLVVLLAIGVWAILPVFLATILLRWGPWRLKNPTWRRLTFDLLAGVALPVLCLWYDPGVLASTGKSDVFVFLFVVLQVLAMTAWLVFDAMDPARKRSASRGFFAGVLGCGAMVAFVMGVFMLPLSVVGLIFYGLGLLGFTPFLTAYSFGCNTARGLLGCPYESRPRRNLAVALGVFMALATPMLITVFFGRPLGDTLDAVLPGRQVMRHGLGGVPFFD